MAKYTFKKLPTTETSTLKAWFSYVGKIPVDRGFYFFPTIADIRQRSFLDFRETPRLFAIGGLEPSNLGDW